MIRVFKASNSNYTTNGEIILKPISAIITKNLEEEYLELDAPLEYVEYLVQDNVIVTDTLAGKKGYRIHNPIVGKTIEVKALLCYQEKLSLPSDRGAVISYGKNLKDCTVDENWDDVVTKLIPIGYKEIRLPEGYLSIVSPYQKTYEKEIEFELSESLTEQVEALEQDIDDLEKVKAGLESGIITLQAKIGAYGKSIISLQAEKSDLESRLTQLGNSEAELKEKAVVTAQIPLVVDDIARFGNEKTNAQNTQQSTRTELTTITNELSQKITNYNNLVMGDLRTQAQDYIDIHKYPQVNYEIKAHIEGIIEVGDIIKVKHPRMKLDLLTNVKGYQFNCLTSKFDKVEFGTLKSTLKGRLNELKEDIKNVSETVKKTAVAVTRYRSEYKRDNEELVSKFASDVYGSLGGVYGLLEQNQSILRQTAALISGTVSRVNANLSTDIASLSIRADQIQSSVSRNYTDLDGKITSNKSLVTQTATAIRSEVSTSINGVNQSISIVEQTANKISWLIKSGTSSTNFVLTDKAVSLISNSIDLTGYVTFSSLKTAGTTEIDGGNIKTGTLDCSKITVTNLSINDVTYGSYPVIDCTGSTGNPNIYIGRGGTSNWVTPSSINMRASDINIGETLSSLYKINLTAGAVRVNSNTLGFYSATPVSKQRVDRIYTNTVTTESLASRFNSLLSALGLLGLLNTTTIS